MSFELDWFPLYADRLLGSRQVRRMGARDFGIYMALLVEEWCEGGPLPDDDQELRTAGKAPIKDVRKVLNQCFVQNGQGWQNDTLEEIRAEQLTRHQRRVEAGRKGGLSKGQALLEQSPSSKGKERKEDENKGKAGSSYSTEFEEWWSQYPRKVKKHRSFICWKARLKEGVMVEELTVALVRYNTKLRAEGTEEEFIQHPTTFLAKGGGYIEEWKLKSLTRPPGTQSGAEGGILDSKFSEEWVPIKHERPAPANGETKGNVGKLAEGLLKRAEGKS